MSESDQSNGSRPDTAPTAQEPEAPAGAPPVHSFADLFHPHGRFLLRLRRVLAVDAGVYEELAEDVGAIPQALAVVAFTALLIGLGSFSVEGVFAGIAWAILTWLSVSALVWLVGNALSDEPVRYAPLLRGVGFAYVWFALFALYELPWVGWMFGLGALVMTLISTFHAVRASMGVGTKRALLVCSVALLFPLALLRALF